MKTQRFRVVDGSRDDSEPITAKIVSCHVCNGSTFIEVRSAITTRGRRITSGVRQLACAQCMAEGRMTLL